MRIGTREIVATPRGGVGADDGRMPYVIAEIGVNHDGSVERALQLTDAAADAGADAVKLQLFRADLLMSRAAKLAAYQKAAGELDPIEMLRRLELSVEQMEPVVQRAHARGIHAIVTVFSVELVKEAERLAWDAYKTASPDIVHRPLLEELMATGRPLIVSTGASEMAEVSRAVEWLRTASERLALLQCVSCYPTPREQANLGAMTDLLHLTSMVGYSDHTREIETGALAVRMGAVMLEKHFTHDRRAVGPDHAASLEAAEFHAYVTRAKGSPPDFRSGAGQDLQSGWGTAIGPREKTVHPIERDVRTVSRQSIVTTRALPAGHVVRREDVTFKRPGTGMLPFRLGEVVGQRVTRAVEADTPVMEGDVGSGRNLHDQP